MSPDAVQELIVEVAAHPAGLRLGAEWGIELQPLREPGLAGQPEASEGTALALCLPTVRLIRVWRG